MRKKGSWRVAIEGGEQGTEILNLLFFFVQHHPKQGIYRGNGSATGPRFLGLMELQDP